MTDPVSPADIRAARERIAPDVVLTPCVRSPDISERTGARVHLKLENLQRTGSFKDRGSLVRLLHLTGEERRRGVVTASAGNHAQAVAYHGGRLGIPVTVVMPATAPLIKVSNTRRYGARVVQRGTVLDDAAVEARRLVEEEELVMVHPFDDPRVIAGQGTIGLELHEQIPDLETVVVPVGGGGLISGIAVALKELNPNVRVVGVEAAAAATAKASRDAGMLVKLDSAETLADGIATKRIGELTFGLIERWVDDLVVVSEEEIASAVLVLLEREKTVAEGAGAVPLAALAGGKIPLASGESVALVVSGGNIDVNMISRIIDRGLVADGRLARLMVKVPDRPGALAGLTRIVADRGANVLAIHHRRAFADISVGDVEIVMHLETRGRDHVEEIVSALEEAGHAVEEDV